jgi:ribosome maturation factor RimP
MDIESALVRLCEPVLSEAGYELVWVEVVGVAGRRTARFFIDTLGGVNLKDCAAVSRLIDPVISRNRIFEGPYVLEVSSPGLERPLVKLSDYQRFAGRKTRLKLRSPMQGRKRYTGLIQGTKDESVIVEIENGELVELPLEAISRANLVFEWK